jgi:phosphohistidine phosphatase
MQLQVWLMRHGEADDPETASRDEERALTQRGRRQVSALGRWLNERCEAPQLILHSPLRRALETAQAFGEAFDGRVPVLEDGVLSPGMRPTDLLGQLQRHSAVRVVCIGHQPDIGDCLGAWTSGGNLHMAPGAIAWVTFTGARSAGIGVLRGLLNPAWFLDR